jgi:cell division protein FtsB
MKDGVKLKIMRILTLALVIIIIAAGFVTIYPTFRQCQALKQKDAELQEEIDAKRRILEKFAENQRRFENDPEFVEAIARRDRRVFPGELVFVFDK